MSKLVEVGDVLEADSKWVWGQGDTRTTDITVGYSYRQSAVDVNHQPIPGYDQTDETRPGKLYVVESARSQGGGYGHGMHDVYPDGWHVTCRELKSDKTYNPAGQVIKFYQTGCFSGMITNPTVVGHMIQITNFVWPN